MPNHDKAPAWFTDRAANLFPSTSYRESPAVVISRSDDGRRWYRHDFRDPDAGESYHPAISLEERLRMMAYRKKSMTEALNSPLLPSGYAPLDPLFCDRARTWLLKAGFHAVRAANLGILYNSNMNRVVLPFTTLSGVRSWTARRLGAEGPKYFGPPTRGLGPAIIGNPGGRVTARAVITEDLLSTWHVHEHTGLTTVCAMGVSISALNLAHLQHAGLKRLYIWLDPDRAGQQGAAHIRGLAERLDIDIRRVNRHTVDPKYIPGDELGEYLEP